MDVKKIVVENRITEIEERWAAYENGKVNSIDWKVLEKRLIEEYDI